MAENVTNKMIEELAQIATDGSTDVLVALTSTDDQLKYLELIISQIRTVIADIKARADGETQKDQDDIQA